jgi:hypothetical protein
MALGGFGTQVAHTSFSVQPSVLYASVVNDWHEKNNHKDTEYSEVAQRRVQLGTTIQRP